MLKALLIDLDGTLADSLPLLYHIYSEFLLSHQREGSLEEFNSLNGLTLPQVVEELVKKYAIKEHPDELVSKYSERLDHYYQDHLPVFPFAKECLTYAKVMGLKLALVTSAKPALAKAFLKQHGLDIPDIITPDGPGKPAPDIYVKALKKLQVDPHEALAIEDAPHGLASAQGAKIPVVHFQGSWRAIFEILQKQQIYNPDFRFHPIDGRFQVNVEKSHAPAHLSREMELLWEEKCRANPRLFNGKIFRYLSFGKEGLAGEFADYKNYLVGGQVTPVSVSGVVHTEDAVLIGKRSSHVSFSNGLLETPPSGTIDPDAQVGRHIDIVRQIGKELFEETDLTEEDILGITPFALIEDKKARLWEIAFSIPLKNQKEIKPSWEYENFFFVEKRELLSFMANRYEEIIPFTRYLLTNFLM